MFILLYLEVLKSAKFVLMLRRVVIEMRAEIYEEAEHRQDICNAEDVKTYQVLIVSCSGLHFRCISQFETNIRE